MYHPFSMRNKKKAVEGILDGHCGDELLHKLNSSEERVSARALSLSIRCIS